MRHVLMLMLGAVLVQGCTTLLDLDKEYGLAETGSGGTSGASTVGTAGATASTTSSDASGVGTGGMPTPCDTPSPESPYPARPYFMIAFDTSSSMLDPVPATGNPIAPSCPGYPANRIGHGRCAIWKAIQTFSGSANFGLASYARLMTGCPAGTCAPNFSTCGFTNVSGNNNGNGCNTGCGPEPSPQVDSSTRAGANILVPMRKDTSPPSPDNTTDLLSWVDNDCSGNKELFPSGCTPMNGMLRDMYRYYSSQWTPPSPIPGSATLPSPLTSAAAGERPCRSVNVVLVTDGQETCDNPADAVDAAADLYAGFTKDGITWKVKTFVLDFGDAGSQADEIAAAGGTGAAQTVTNEAEINMALENIISTAVPTEMCDKIDNDCDGCVDEGCP